jgi:hypothetical protein
MDFSELDGLTVDCRWCRKPIEQEDQGDSWMVRVWVPRISQYRAEGPFHSECVELREKQTGVTPD